MTSFVRALHQNQLPEAHPTGDYPSILFLPHFFRSSWPARCLILTGGVGGGGLDHRRRKTSDSVNYPMIRCLRSMSRSLAVHDKKDHRYREITIPGRSQLILWGSQDKLSVSGPIVLLLLNQVWWKWLSGGLPWQAWIITRFSDWVGARGLSVHIWRCRV